MRKPSKRAIGYAQRSGNERAELEATMWLLYTFVTRMPVDAGIGRGEQALAAAHGDPWNEAVIRMIFAPLYACVGRFADAREAIARSRAVFARSGARYNWAIAAYPAGLIETIAGDAAAAEQVLRGGYEANRATGDQANSASIAAMLADAIYAQGRLAEAQQLADQARSSPSAATSTRRCGGGRSAPNCSPAAVGSPRHGSRPTRALP